MENPEPFISAVWSYHLDRHAHDLGYAYYDVNQDGTDELIIGYDYSLEVYTFDGTQAVAVHHDDVHTSLSLANDGTIIVRSVSSANTGSVEHWVIGADGYTVEQTMSAAYDENTSTEELQRLLMAEQRLDAFDFDWQVLAPSAPGDYAISVSNTNERAHEEYEMIVEEYLDAQQNGLPGLENFNVNQSNYPHLSSIYLESYIGEPLCAAYLDVDGNGIDELFIGTDIFGSTWLLDVYVFNGTEAVSLDNDSGNLFNAYFGAVTSDGLFLTGGNGGAALEPVYRLGTDGYSLEEASATDTNFQNGSLWNEIDLSKHGGMINDILTWMILDVNYAAPEWGKFDACQGNYVNSETGVTVRLTMSRGARYLLYASLPDDPSRLATYELQLKGGTLQCIYTGYPILILKLQDEQLLIENTSKDKSRAYLEGLYSPT